MQGGGVIRVFFAGHKLRWPVVDDIREARGES